jgi:hypothetical protein
MAAQRSVLEVLGVVFIITLPTVPVVYFMWRAIVCQDMARKLER